MLKWLRDRNAPTRVTVIESLPVDGKRRVILVSRDNTEHLVMVGGRNDLVIERNIMDPRPMQRAGLQRADQTFSNTILPWRSRRDRPSALGCLS